MMYPTLASLVEERMRDDPDLCADVIHALNQWMSEVWPYAFEERIFSTPVISTGLVDRAIVELDYVIEKGARAILVRPAPAWGYRGPRSFALPEFDPFWQRVEEVGLLVVLHASDSGYNRYTNEWEGVRGEAAAFGEPRLFELAIHDEHRAIRDACTSIIFHGLLQRFPGLRFALVENGAGWVPQLLGSLDHAYRKAPQQYPELPSSTFKRHFWMHPFHEEDPRELIRLLGADRVIFGSDFPHIEGLADPLSWAKEVHGLPEDQLRLVMGGNMMQLLGIAA
jgi:predicted TIM-barrel fold metal-dependent hydrolase